MRKVFEDEFMDLQAGLISLCLEVTENRLIKFMHIVIILNIPKCLMLFLL
jgi:hypothetical protein